MSKKYELTDETILFRGSHPTRIKALKDFGDVKKGDLGGFIESEENLSQDGYCWIGGDAFVFENAKVKDNAKVCGDARVCGDAYIVGNAVISDEASIDGNTIIGGRVKIGGNAKIEGFTAYIGDIIIADRPRSPETIEKVA